MLDSLGTQARQGETRENKVNIWKKKRGGNFVQAAIKFLHFFSQVPSCLILQMPRFGSRYKMYDMILPNLELDVTHIVENGASIKQKLMPSLT